MTAIWQHDGTGWRLIYPAGFPAEATLHDLVDQAPQILPLSGSPKLIVLGREVLLGGNYADLIALEPFGRLVIIEIKLAKNAEARRAVIAQILTYAAYLRGIDIPTLERDVLAPHLAKRGYADLADAVAQNDQEGSFDRTAFVESMTEGLRQGSFRLVLVLDEAPAELVRLVGYLQAVSDKLVIDLVTVGAFDFADTRIVVPQRVEPDQTLARPSSPATKVGRYSEGAGAFEDAALAGPAKHHAEFRRLTEWARNLEREGLVKLGTYQGSGKTTLLPRLRVDDVGLVTIGNDGAPYLQFWRSVIDRHASSLLPQIEGMANSPKVGQGTTTRVISDDLLHVLTAAYRIAAKGRVSLNALRPSLDDGDL